MAGATAPLVIQTGNNIRQTITASFHLYFVQVPEEVSLYIDANDVLQAVQGGSLTNSGQKHKLGRTCFMFSWC